MQLPSLTHLVGGALFLGIVVLAFLRASRIEPPRLRLVVPNIWLLDTICRATGVILRSGPAPKRVAIDLTNIAHIDDSSMASLDYACTRWAEAGVHVTIEGCNRNVAEALWRRSLRADVQCQAHGKNFTRPMRLH